MRDLFQQELREVQDQLISIAELVASSITDAVEAFNKSDVTLAESVIARDNQIDDATSSAMEMSWSWASRNSCWNRSRIMLLG